VKADKAAVGLYGRLVVAWHGLGGGTVERPAWLVCGLWEAMEGRDAGGFTDSPRPTGASGACVCACACKWAHGSRA